jgi:hypothetical protein
MDTIKAAVHWHKLKSIGRKIFIKPYTVNQCMVKGIFIIDDQWNGICFIGYCENH